MLFFIVFFYYLLKCKENKQKKKKKKKTTSSSVKRGFKLRMLMSISSLNMREVKPLVTPIERVSRIRTKKTEKINKMKIENPGNKEQQESSKT